MSWFIRTFTLAIVLGEEICQLFAFWAEESQCSGGCLNQLVSGVLFTSLRHQDLIPMSQWLAQTFVPVLLMDELNLLQRRVFLRDPVTSLCGFFPFLSQASIPLPKNVGPSSQDRGSLPFSEVLYMSLGMEVHRNKLVKKVSCNGPFR